MTQLTVKGLWKEYDNQVVLENVNLEIGEHEFVTVIGASGCGKTTFLRLLLGVETPTRGRLLIDGRPLPQRARTRSRDRVSALFALSASIGARQSSAGPGAPRIEAWGDSGASEGAAALDKADRLLDAVGLAPRATNIPRNSPGACSSDCPSHNR